MSSVRHKTIEHEIFGGPLCVILLALDNTISERAKRKIFVKNIQNREISSTNPWLYCVPVILHGEDKRPVSCSFLHCEICWLCLSPFTVHVQWSLFLWEKFRFEIMLILARIYITVDKTTPSQVNKVKNGTCIRTEHVFCFFWKKRSLTSLKLLPFHW